MRRARANLIAGAAIAALLAAARAAAGPAPDAPVRTDAGLVSGVVADESAGVRAYKGLPFAAPPVGDLRWKPPQPVPAWEGVRACTAPGPWCPQPRPILGQAPDRASEDCLYLNVWAPAKTADGRLPVMVWIHGGGFTTGSGGSPLYDGTALARRGAVLVTINYRLGPFGFLAHPLLSKESPEGVSGNYGLLDQVAALGWVRRNIAAFGGDPGCVTIFGESAGSCSVVRLMVSPLAKGLFHRAIGQSGGARGNNRHLRARHEGMEPAEAVGERIAKALGCDGADDVLKALRAKTADELLAAADPAQGLFGAGTKFGPVVDGWALPDDPDALWQAGKQAAVPFLTGTTADEGTVFVRRLPARTADEYRRSARTLFGGRADDVLRLFPADGDAEVRAAQASLTTVSAFIAPARALARSMAGRQPKTYLYHFTRESRAGRFTGLGVFHASEIPYVFDNLTALAGPKDRDLARVMGDAWVRFARTGDPNGPGLPEWPAYDAAGDRHLEFGDQVKAGSGLWCEACDLFDQVRIARPEGSDATEP